MARYPQGQPVRLSVGTQQINSDGTYSPANDSTLSLVVQAPDGTRVTYPGPVNDGTGLYHQDIPVTDLAQLGHYQYAWTASGIAAGVIPGGFEVFDPFEVSVLQLQDAKEMLNIPQATTTFDTELLAWIAGIQSSLERFTGGPVVNRQVTERAEAVAGLSKICLRQRPVVSVTSIVAESSGATISTSDLKVDTNSGILQRATGWPFAGPFFGTWMTVTYVAGWGTSIPAAFGLFARIVIANMWETQRGETSLPMSVEEAVSVPGFAYLIPRRAAELLDGSVNGVPFRTEAYI